MKIEISYFYQIRNFTRNRVPMSTCITDPGWYHDNKGENYIFKDKRGILNGLRLLPLIIHQNLKCGGYTCEEDPKSCSFLSSYRALLDTVNFETMYKGIQSFAEKYKKENNIEEEIIMTLIVYEAPQNKCSERNALIDYFISKGIEVKEFIF